MDREAQPTSEAMEKRQGGLPQLSPTRRNRLVLIGAMTLVILWFLYRARRGLLLFALGLFLAYLLVPLVDLGERLMPQALRRRGLARPLAIFLTYLVALAVLGGLLTLLIPPLARQVGILASTIPQYYQKVQTLANDWFYLYQDIPPEWQKTVQDNLQKLTGAAAVALKRGVFLTVGVFRQTLSFVLGILIIPFWLFYILKDEKKGMASLKALVPPAYQEDFSRLLSVVDGILGAYLRGQLILCFFVGAMATLGLLALGVDFALLLGIAAGVFEFIPTIGPFLGAIPALLVAALGSPKLALWVVVLFVLIQQVENLLLVPRVAGRSVRVHPALVMVVLVIGSEVWGIWGMAIAVPATAVIRDVFRYLYLRFGREGVSPAEAWEKVTAEQRAADRKGRWPAFFRRRRRSAESGAEASER